MPEPGDIETMLDAAISAHEAHDPDQAQRLCQQLLRSDPDNPEALNLLGVILQDRGLAEESIALISRAVEIDPAFSDAFANLARGYRFTGEEGRAVTAARQATELDPSLGEGWLQLGFALVTLGRYEEALPVLREAVARVPDAADLYVSLAATAQTLKEYQASVDAWREVLRLRPDRNDATINLGVALFEMDQLDEAVALHRRAVERAPGDVTALAALARTLHRRFEGAELVSVCRQILEIDPSRLDILAMLSNGQIWLGQFDDIETTRAAVLAVEPENKSFAQQLGAVIPGTLDDAGLALCHSQLHDTGLPIGDRVNAGYALARALDRAADFDAAFEAFRTTNALTHEADLAANQGFNPAELRNFVDNTIARYTRPLFAAFRPMGNPSELPIFIVGMPRSGTSLVEQIAASHPRVFGAGELKIIMELVTRLNRDRGFVWPTQWDMDQFRAEASNHIDRLRALGGDVDRVIDKLPDNIQMLGHIRLLFPNARIIICRRDLRDVCVSCYTTRFGDQISWSNDLRDCATRAVEIERLTEHWRSVLPGPVLEVRYETLVENLETESRRLIDFLGLDWDPACLEFHKTQRPVTTSSAWQVRQPLYDSSVGRWRSYHAHLGPMLKILAPYIPDETSGTAIRTSADPSTPSSE
jgi:tetratricopeptide (TPR) repeat protein